MASTGFQEKMLWSQLVGILIVVLFYGHFLVHARAGHHYFHAVLLALIILFALARVLIRRRSNNVLEDERDSAIAVVGARWSNTTLWLGLVILLIAYWDHGSAFSVHLLIGLIFHLLVAAASIRVIRELVAHRMSA